MLLLYERWWQKYILAVEYWWLFSWGFHVVLISSSAIGNIWCEIGFAVCPFFFANYMLVDLKEDRNLISFNDHLIWNKQYYFVVNKQLYLLCVTQILIWTLYPLTYMNIYLFFLFFYFWIRLHCWQTSAFLNYNHKSIDNNDFYWNKLWRYYAQSVISFHFALGFWKLQYSIHVTCMKMTRIF